MQILENTNKGVEGWTFAKNNVDGKMEEVLVEGVRACKFQLDSVMDSCLYFSRNANLAKIKNNTTYTIILDALANYENANLQLLVQDGNSKNKLIDFGYSGLIQKNVWKKIKLVATSNDTEIQQQILYIAPGSMNEAGESITIKNIMLVEGDYSNSDLEWEDYTGVSPMPNTEYSSEIRACGEGGSITAIIQNGNFADNGENYQNWYYSNNKHYNSLGNGFTLVNGADYSRIANLKLKNMEIGQNYTAICDVKLVTAKQVVMALTDGTNRDYGKSILTSGELRWTFTYTGKPRFNLYLTTNEAEGNSAEITNFRIVKEGSDEAYLEHKEQKYVMPCQREMLDNDYFDFENNQEVHIWNHYTVNGNGDMIFKNVPNTELANSSETAYFLIYLPLNAQSDSSLKDNVLCDSFKNLCNALDLYNNNFEESVSVQTQLRLRIKKLRLAGWNDSLTADEKVNLLKAFLAENNLDVYYRLEEPIKLEFTEAQKEVAKEIEKAVTYKNATIIYSEDEISPIFDVEYYKDLETYIAENKGTGGGTDLSNVNFSINENGELEVEY